MRAGGWVFVSVGGHVVGGFPTREAAEAWAAPLRPGSGSVRPMLGPDAETTRRRFSGLRGVRR